MSGKRHAHVLRAIGNLLPQLPEDHQRNSGLMVPVVQIGCGATRRDPACRITRDTLLAMGFTGKKALALKLAHVDALAAE